MNIIRKNKDFIRFFVIYLEASLLQDKTIKDFMPVQNNNLNKVNIPTRKEQK